MTAPAAIPEVQAPAPPEVWGCEFEPMQGERQVWANLPMAERMQGLLKEAKRRGIRCTWVGNSVEHPLVEPVELVEGEL